MIPRRGIFLSIVVSILACHVSDRGSIPRGRGFLMNDYVHFLMDLDTVSKSYCPTTINELSHFIKSRLSIPKNQYILDVVFEEKIGEFCAQRKVLNVFFSSSMRQFQVHFICPMISNLNGSVGF